MLNRQNIVLIIWMAGIVALASVAACTRGEKFVEPTGWKSYSPECDSLTRRIELEFLFEQAPDSIERLVDRFRTAAKGVMDDREQESRVRFWNGRLASRRGDRGLRKSEYEAAVRIAPAPTAEYVTHRLRWFDERRQDFSAPEWYEYKLKEAEYFRSRRDYMMLYHEYLELMELMRETGLRRRARDFFTLTDESNSHIDSVKKVRDYKINLAALLSDEEDYEGAAVLNRELLLDSACTRDYLTYQNVNLNLYFCDLDTVALHNAYRSLMTRGDRTGRLPRVYAALVAEGVGRGDRGAVSMYLDSLERRIDDFEPGIKRLYAFKAYAEGKALCSGKGEALEAYRRYAAEADSMVKEFRANGVANLEVASAIAGIDRRIDQERRKTRMRFWGAVAVFLVALTAAGVWFERRARRLRRERREAEERKRVAEHRQMAVQLDLDRRGVVLEKAAEKLGDIKARGVLSVPEVMSLERILSDKGISEIGSGDFLELFSRQYPAFISRLRETAPRISDPALRLAGYIAIGLGTKEISVLLNVRPESVRQAKWRLRRTLGIDKEDALFPFLSGLLHDCL